LVLHIRLRQDVIRKLYILRKLKMDTVWIIWNGHSKRRCGNYHYELSTSRSQASIQPMLSNGWLNSCESNTSQSQASNKPTLSLQQYDDEISACPALMSHTVARGSCDMCLLFISRCLSLSYIIPKQFSFQLSERE
jgi:hypothetical protein